MTNALADISIQLTAIGVPGTATLALVRAAPEFNPLNALYASIAAGAANKPLTARTLLLHVPLLTCLHRRSACW